MTLASKGLACLSIAANVLLAGGVFTFPLISPVLKSHLTQPQLTTIVLAGMAGQYPLTPLVGSLIDRHGPWLCSLIASVLFAFAFGSFSFLVDALLSSDSREPQTSVYLLVSCFALAGFATVFAYFSSLFSATRMFPRYPGAAAGTVMALFGLSPLLLSSIAANFFTTANKSLKLVEFMEFLALITGTVLLFGAWSLSLSLEMPSPATESENSDSTDSETTPLIPRVRPAAPESDGIFALLQDWNFWILFFILMVTLGPCEMIISNIGTIVLALPSGRMAPTDAVALQVKILSIFNTGTRLIVGPFADFVSPVRNTEVMRRHYISRAVFLVLPAAILAASALWLIFIAHSQTDIWLLSIGTGVAYGATFTVLPSVIASVWGAANQGRNFGFIVYAPLIGTTIFSYFYAFMAEAQTPSGGVCAGKQCFTTTFKVSGLLQASAVGWSIFLWRRWRKLL